MLENDILYLSRLLLRLWINDLIRFFKYNYYKKKNHQEGNYWIIRSVIMIRPRLISLYKILGIFYTKRSNTNTKNADYFSLKKMLCFIFYIYVLSLFFSRERYKQTQVIYRQTLKNFYVTLKLKVKNVNFLRDSKL